MIKAHKLKMLYEDQVAIFYTYSFKKSNDVFPSEANMTNSKCRKWSDFGLHQAKLASEIYFHKTSEAKSLAGFKTRGDISADYMCKTSAIL